MKYDITLLNLNMLYIRYMDKVEKELHLPLGCLYLTRALENAGFKVDFRDYQLNEFEEPFNVDNIVKFLEDSADIIGISCMANLLPFAILSLKKLKEIAPFKKLLLGGVGPFSVERKILERFDFIDVIGVSEGEKTLPLLVKCLKSDSDLSKVPGIYFRSSEGKVVFTGFPERIKNLDKLEFPAFEKVNLLDYEGYGMMTSRGCPYPCTFCSVAPIWNHQSYLRSNENIIEEMKYLVNNAGVEIFLFQDEYFMSGKNRMLAFCEALKKSGLKVKFKAFGRVDLVDLETLEKMQKAGCVEIRFGVESGSDKVLKDIKKGFSSDTAFELLYKAAEIMPRVDAFYMWGFPFEDMEDFSKTLFQMITLRSAGVRILPSLLSMLPQTEIYEKYKTDEKLEFSTTLLPEYMITGHEVCKITEIDIKKEHSYIFNFIKENRDLFPGFLLYDIENNIIPKYELLKQFGFYPDISSLENYDSCGAHSPKTILT